jgi:iron complex outermembrane receptor protein
MIRAILLLGTGVAIVWAGAAAAQQQPTTTAGTIGDADAVQAAPGSSTSDGPQAGDDGTIVVTGSRIARPELESAMPVAVLEYQTTRNFGYNTVYDALQLNPAIGPGLGNNNSQGEAFDTGVANINLRNLGVNRSLVLVDGKRWVSSGARTSAVDLNTIPDALIDRVEVVTGGAAAIYGADAVTGAVNLILRKNLKGFRLSATNGISQQGDANQTSISASAGLDFNEGRGSFITGGTYNFSDPVRWADRYVNRISFVTNPASTGPADGVPDNILEPNLRFIQRAGAPTFFYNNQFYVLQNGALSPTSYDRTILAGGLGNGSGGIGATNFENHFLRNKSENVSTYSRLNYEFSPAISVGTIFAFGKSYTRGPTVFPEIRDDSRATWWGGRGGEVARLTDPFLPTSLQQFMVANNLTSVPLNRTYLNLPQPFEIHDRENVTFGSDASGRLSGRLNWSVFAQYGQVTDHVTTTNAPKSIEWVNARDVVIDPGSGQPVCANSAARAQGCVPFNFYTTDRPSQAFLDYALADRFERRKNTLFTTGASITGKAVSLPYGELSVALGTEWRRETLSTRDDPDTDKLSGIVFGSGTDYVRHPELDASRDTFELFGEVVAPILADLPFARRLEIEGAYRYSHYSDTPETNTWKVGGTWEPLSGLSFRGVYSRSVRIPNFGELYSPQIVQTVGITNDPCSGVYITQGPNRARNCAAILSGTAAPLPYPNTNAPRILLGGNPDLTPEKSESVTFGTVIQPRFVPGLDITVDYFNIKIDDAITAVPYLDILNLCVDAAAGPNPFYCGLVNRNAAGQIVTVQAANYNLAQLQARGIDFGLSYRRDVGPGRLQLRFNGTYLLEQTTVATRGRTGIDYAGQWTNPEFKGTLLSSYQIGTVALGVNTRFISRSAFNIADASQEVRDPYNVPAYVYNDVTLQFSASDRFTFSLGVKNVSDVRVFGALQDTGPGPNSSGGAQTGSAYYDAIGRYLFAKVDLKL